MIGGGLASYWPSTDNPNTPISSYKSAKDFSSFFLSFLKRPNSLKEISKYRQSNTPISSYKSERFFLFFSFLFRVAKYFLAWTKNAFFPAGFLSFVIDRRKHHNFQQQDRDQLWFIITLIIWLTRHLLLEVAGLTLSSKYHHLHGPTSSESHVSWSLSLSSPSSSDLCPIKRCKNQFELQSAKLFSHISIMAAFLWLSAIMLICLKEVILPIYFAHCSKGKVKTWHRTQKLIESFGILISF